MYSFLFEKRVKITQMSRKYKTFPIFSGIWLEQLFRLDRYWCSLSSPEKNNSVFSVFLNRMFLLKGG